MSDEQSSNEKGAYRRSGWVVATALIGSVVMICGLCALTPDGHSIVDRMRAQLNISDSLQFPAPAVLSTSTLEPPVGTSPPKVTDGPTPLANSATNIPTASPAPTLTRTPRPTQTPTARPTDLPTAPPTETASAQDTPTPNILPTLLATLVPTGIVETLVPTGIVATLVPTVNVPTCVCVGVDQVCTDGATRYNVSACGGTDKCQCRGTSLFCPNGTVKLLSSQCLP